VVGANDFIALAHQRIAEWNVPVKITKHSLTESLLALLMSFFGLVSHSTDDIVFVIIFHNLNKGH